MASESRDPNRFREDPERPGLRLGWHTRAQFEAMVRAACDEVARDMPAPVKTALARTLAVWLEDAREDAPL